MYVYLRFIRLPNLLVIVLTQLAIRWFVLEPVLFSLGSSYSLSNLIFGLLIFSTVLIAAAGYIINEIDRIPNKNEHLFLTIGHVIIKKASSRRIEQIQIFKN